MAISGDSNAEVGGGGLSSNLGKILIHFPENHLGPELAASVNFRYEKVQNTSTDIPSKSGTPHMGTDTV
jgi:hypothetical protein